MLRTFFVVIDVIFRKNMRFSVMLYGFVSIFLEIYIYLRRFLAVFAVFSAIKYKIAR